MSPQRIKGAPDPVSQILQEEGSIKYDFPIRTGRAVYNDFSLTGLNEIPVLMHCSYVLSGAAYKNLLLDPEEITIALLVEPAVVLIKSKTTGWGVAENIIHATANKVLQQLQDTDPPDLIREYSLTAEKWIVRDYVDYGESTQREIDENSRPLNKGEVLERPKKIQVADFYIFPSAGNILYKAQIQYMRLEEIAWTMRIASTGAAATNIISGYIGGEKQAEASLNSGKRNVFMPGNVTVQKIGGTTFQDQQIREFTRWLSLYYERVRIVDTGDEPDRPVGQVRRLRMIPMLGLVRRLRYQLEGIVTALGGSIQFDEIIVSAPADRDMEMAILERVRSRIGDEMYWRRMLAIAGISPPE